MMALLIISIGIGIFYILIGFFAKKYPSTISGYNKLDEYQKQVHPTIVFKTLVIVGIITITGSSIAALFSSDIGILVSIFLPVLIMPIYFAWKTKQTAKVPKKSDNRFLAFSILFAICVPIGLILSAQEPSIIVQNEGVKITGLYGETIPIKEIASIEMTKTIPSVELRTNGLGLGNVLKGYFLMERIGTAKLFLSSLSGPYIKIQTVSKRYIYISFKDESKTIDAYNQIKSHYDR